MLYTSAQQIDLSGYQRFFVFGCSFTGYRWATWADLIAREMPHAEYVNVGRSGAGQLYILSQLSQCINHYNIGENDLVGIMWSTFYREDRYMYQRASDNWSTPGNILTAQHEVPQEYIDNYVCTRGMFVRDMAIIDTTMRMLEHSEFDSFAMLGVGLDHQDWTAGLPPDSGPPMDDIKQLYSEVNTKLLPPLMDTQFPEGWDTCYKYFDDSEGTMYPDYHPSVLQYKSYLETLGFEFSSETESYARAEHERMMNISNRSQLEDHHPCMIL
jgi:hypothetical protein